MILHKETGKSVNDYINNELDYLVSLLKTSLNNRTLTHIKKPLGIPWRSSG